MFNIDNINDIDPAAKFESKMLMSISLGDGSFSTGSGGSVSLGDGSASGSYDTFGTGVVGDPLSGGLRIEDLGGSGRSEDEIRADVEMQVQAAQNVRNAVAQDRQATEAAMAYQQALQQGVMDRQLQSSLDLQSINSRLNERGIEAYLPSYMQIGGPMMLNKMRGGILSGAGYEGYYDKSGRIMGMDMPNFFGGTSYTGRPDFDPRRTEEGGDQPDRPLYPYPMTAEEEEEEREATQDEIDKEFQMQYIRPKGGFYPERGAYARTGLLDTMPDGLLEFMPDFARQNKAFRMGSATRPEYFQDPYDLGGYSLLS